MSPSETLAAMKPDWKKLIANYSKPDLNKSIRELLVTFVPLLVLTILMYLSLRVSVWLTLALSIPTAGFLIRTFIILHDCGHGSFFKSMKANDWVGLICGVVTFTPYYQWRHSHAIHHASSGDLDRRGVGDVMTLTVREYLALPWYRKIYYRIYRNPIVLFVIAPVLLFLVAHRFSFGPGGKRERWSVHFTNVALLAVFMTLGYFLGFWNVILVHIPAFALASLAGVWMFYVQHQFEDTYWEHHPEWEYLAASLQGSSYYKLPKILQWFTGNIGFHHIHHLSPKIPNYNLPKAFKENPVFQHVTIVTFWESLKTISLKLWDEEKRVMVGWKYLKTVKMTA